MTYSIVVIILLLIGVVSPLEVIAGPSQNESTPSSQPAKVASEQRSELSEGALKLFTYHGGLVSLLIPQDWVVEESDNGAMMYPPGAAEYPTLRLNVLTFTGPRPMKISDLEHAVSLKTGGERATVTRSRSGYPISHVETESSEGAMDLTIHTWKIGQTVPPGTVRIVAFTLTLPRSQARSPAHKALVRQLDHEIQKTKIADLPASSSR